MAPGLSAECTKRERLSSALALPKTLTKVAVSNLAADQSSVHPLTSTSTPLIGFFNHSSVIHQVTITSRDDITSLQMPSPSAAAAAATAKIPHSHFFANAASSGSDIYTSLPQNVWLQRSILTLQTFAIPFAYYFRPLCSVVAFLWYVSPSQLCSGKLIDTWSPGLSTAPMEY